MLSQDATPKNYWLNFIIGAIVVLLGGMLGFFVVDMQSPALIVAGVLAAIVAALTIANLDFGLFVLIFISYTHFSHVLIREFNAPSVARPYIALLIGAIGLRWILNGNISKGWGRAAVLVVAYGMVVFASLLYATDFQIASEAATDFLKDGIIMVVVVILMNNAVTFRKVIWALLVAGMFMGSISVFQGLTGLYDNQFYGFGRAGMHNIVGETEGQRVSGPIGDPNYYAQIMLVIIPLAINRFSHEKKRVLKWIAGWAVVAGIITVILTYSRGAVVAVIVMAVFAMLHRPPRLTDVLIGLLLIALLLTFAPTSYFARVASITDIFSGEQGVREDVSYRGRASEMIAAWLIFLDHPFFGVGVENYPIYYQQYSRRLGLDPRSEQRQAHNLYLQIAAETGLAGLLVYGWVLWTIFQGMLRSWRRLISAGYLSHASMVHSFAAGMFGYMAAAFFIHGAYPRYFWLLAGIALAIPSVTDSIFSANQKALNEE